MAGHAGAKWTGAHMLESALQRARDVGLPATLTLDEWQQALAHFDGLCAYCARRPAQELDHFLPLALGGGTTAENCVPACTPCNQRKRHALPQAVFPPRVIARVAEYLQNGQDEAQLARHLQRRVRWHVARINVSLRAEEFESIVSDLYTLFRLDVALQPYKSFKASLGEQAFRCVEPEIYRLLCLARALHFLDQAPLLNQTLYDQDPLLSCLLATYRSLQGEQGGWLPVADLAEAVEECPRFREAARAQKLLRQTKRYPLRKLLTRYPGALDLCESDGIYLVRAGPCARFDADEGERA